MSATVTPHPGAAVRGDPNLLISIVASTAAALLGLTAPFVWESAVAAPTAFVVFLAVTAVLQLVSVEVYNRGSISFAGTGLLALGFTFGASAAMATAAVMGIVSLIARRGRVNRGIFDAAQFALAAGAGSALYHLLTVADWPAYMRFLPALGAGAMHMAVNMGLLCFAMSLAEGTSPLSIWNERFRWFTPYNLASGPLALALTLAYERMGVAGLLAFALPPAFMMLSVRQYVARTRASVAEVRRANEELQRANSELAERNQDLHALFEFAGGLSARAHDRKELVAYAESSVSFITGTRVRVVSADATEGVPLMSGGTRVGGILLDDERTNDARWARLRDAILPQLATALESVDLIEEVRTTHLATIAALSRSMEAKDHYTGGHTERVSDVAVALAKRLGYAGADLDAVEIGALLHDIGKIGIPERILHKPGPLDEEEWEVMKEHPVISEYILAGVDLSPIVLQIARHSHESYDGSGYPDGLAGEQIPLAARIVLVADAFDALTSDRPYRTGRHVRAALDEIGQHAGTQFCPRVVDALRSVFAQEPHVLGAAGLRAVEVA